ncbi:hypothetical protein [Aeoliella sp.]|uniref:hypothetical protein n=1 Tax=Aeoliella sp. TaxID=2795800 RepID=UPI003CCBC84A
MTIRYSLRTLVLFLPFALVYYPCVALGGLLILFGIAPLAFLASGSLENATDRTVWVTPVGTVGPQGDRHLLPLYRPSWPMFIKAQQGHFRVEPGETFEFVYDMDDINFSELVIEDENGGMGQIVVNPTPTTPQYIVPAQTDYVLDNQTALKPVPAKVAAAARGGTWNGQLWWMYAVCVPLALFELLRQLYLASRRK